MKIELTIEEINVVLLSLSKQPIEFALPVFEKIKQQAQEQVSVGSEE